MTTVSRRPVGVDRDDRPPDGDERFLGRALPSDLDARRALRLYVRRLLILILAAFTILLLIATIALLISLTTIVGIIGTISVVLAAAALIGITILLVRRPANVPRRRAGRPRRVAARVIVALPAIIVIVAALGSLRQDDLRVEFTLLTLAATLGAAFVGLFQAKRAEVATTAWVKDSRITTALARTFQPMTTALGNVVAAHDPTDRHKAVEVLITKAIGLAKTMSGATSQSRTRSMYYHFQSEDRLVLRAYEGEYGEPREDFRAANSENDRRVVELARGETVLFVNNLIAAPPSYFSNPTQRPYKSLISVPVRAGDRAFGVLMIDAEEANSLTGIDVGYAILIAGLLGVGLAAAEMPASITQGARADTSYIREFAETLDSVFAASLAHVAMSFQLIPDEDRRFLADDMTLQTYSHSVNSLAEERAERQLDELQQWIRSLFRVESWAKSAL